MKVRKAIVVAPRKIEIIEEELPKLAPNQVLLKTISIGMCHTDLPTFLGVNGVSVSKYGTVRMGVGEQQFPTALGHEPVCEVVEIGSEVKNFYVGEIVAGFWPDAFADYLIVGDDCRMLAEIPKGGKPVKYCIAEPLGCIVNIARAASCKYGDNIAVIGCGFMGLMIMAALRKSGAEKLVAVDILDNKLELAKKAGATHTINSLKEIADERAYELTNGHFFDVVVEITGSLKGLNTAGQIIKSTHDKGMDHFDGTYRGAGKILLPSVYAKEEKFPPELAYNFMLRTPELIATHPTYDTRPRENMELAIRSYMDGRLPADEFINYEFDFEDIQKAFEMLDKPTPDYIKGIVTFK